MKAFIIILVAIIWGAITYGGSGAIGFGLAAFVLCKILMKPDKDIPPALREESPPEASTAYSLRDRVALLEHMVATLQAEVRQLQGEERPAPAEPQAAPDHPAMANAFDTVFAAPLPVQKLPSFTPAAPLTTEESPPQAIAMPADIAPPEVAVSQSVPTEHPPANIPAVPAGPGWVETHINNALLTAKNWLLGGNTVVRVGILILFFGMAFLLKFAADNSMLPVELRFAATAVGAILLLVTGWRLKDKRRDYALIMQGGGVATLYLTAFTAFKFAILPPGFALVCLVLTAIFSAILAIRQDARSLAIAGISGGFIAPILTATQGGSHIALFSYFALLNAGIFAMAWYKTWRPLNLLGFIFTFGIGSSWGLMQYRPELLSSTEPFLILFFLFYVGIALLYALRQQVALKSYVDGTLIFGTPLAAFALQALLVQKIEFALAASAVVLSAFYLTIAGYLWRLRRNDLRLLVEAMLALGILFATLAIPLAFDARTTSASWAVEAAAIIWVSLRQQRLRSLLCALVLQVIAGIAFFNHSGPHLPDALPLLNSAFIGCLMLALSGLFSAGLMHEEPARQWFKQAANAERALAGWALLWWVGGGISEIMFFVPAAHQYHTLLLFAGLTALLASLICKKWHWPLLRLPALALLPALSLISIVLLSTTPHPLAGLGALAWPVLFPLALWLLWRHEAEGKINGSLHALGIYLLSVLLATELIWQIGRLVPEGVWRNVAWPLISTMVLWLLARYGNKVRWPVMRHPEAYFLAGAIPVAAGLLLWTILALGSDGNPAPLPYLPLINPLDIALGLALAGLLAWIRSLQKLKLADLTRYIAPGLLLIGFVWLNAVLLRVFHHYGDEAYSLNTLLGSAKVQAVFALFWSAVSVLVIRAAKRFGALAVTRRAVLALLAALWSWLLLANLTDGSLLPLPYLPLLNLLELAQLAVLGALYLAWRDQKDVFNLTGRTLNRLAYIALATVFIWFNGTLFRGLHHLLAFPFSLAEALHSATMQQVLMLGWGLFSLAALQLSKNRLQRLLAIACAPVMLMMWLWTFFANLSQDGGSLSRLPLLNPLDLIQLGIFALLGLWLWRVQQLRSGQPLPWLKTGAGITLFVWLNGVLLRTLHHWNNVPYKARDLLASMQVQTSLSIFWTLLACSLMLTATRRQLRPLWFSGAGLLAVVVGKLFLIDLSRVSGIERIISFIGVGILLLLIGYFSPLPPKEHTDSPAE